MELRDEDRASYRSGVDAERLRTIVRSSERGSLCDLWQHGRHLPETASERAPAFQVENLAQLLRGQGRPFAPSARGERVAPGLDVRKAYRQQERQGPTPMSSTMRCLRSSATEMCATSATSAPRLMYPGLELLEVFLNHPR
jgi:hypothetical protein